MGSKLHLLSNAEFKSLRDKRTAIANWIGLLAAALVGLGLFFGPPSVQTLAQPVAAVLVVVFGVIFWFWLRPLTIEDRRRGGSESK